MSQDLLKAQGYYYGQTKLWLPRALFKGQESQREPLQEDIPHNAQPKKEWRPVTHCFRWMNKCSTTSDYIEVEKTKVDPKETN